MSVEFQDILDLLSPPDRSSTVPPLTLVILYDVPDASNIVVECVAVNGSEEDQGPQMTGL